MEEVYNLTTVRKAAKPRSKDLQDTNAPATGGGAVMTVGGAAYMPDTATATNANHAKTADTATTAETANNAQRADKSATAEALQTANFNAGASGARVADDGSAEFETLTVRGFIKAAEYVINRIKITEGAQWLTEGGVIEKVVDTTPRGLVPFRSYDITMRERFAGDTQAPFVAGDIIRGQYNNLQGGGDVQTSWMAVLKVEGRVVTVKLYQNGQVPGGANAQPIVQMRVARWGNADANKPERQSHIVLDPERGQIVRRVNVNAPIIDNPEQVDGFSLGTLPTWVQNALGGAVNENSNYLYARGIITQDIIRFSPQGQPIAERVDRGAWSAKQSYYHEGKNETTGIFEISRVWLDGTLYELAPHGDGRVRPSANNTNWIVVQEKPRDGNDGHTSHLHIKYSNDGGRNFTSPDGETVGDYIGQCTDFNVVAPSSPSAYKWSKMKGEQGERGKAGRDGVEAQANLLLGTDFNRDFDKNEVVGKWYKRKTEGTKFGDARISTAVSPVFGTKVAGISATYLMSATKDEWSELVYRAEKSLIPGKQYVFSVYAKCADVRECKFWLCGWYAGFQTAFVAVRDWERFSFSFVAGSASMNFSVRVWNKKGDKPDSNGILFAAPKLEEGTVATPWTPAHDDLRGAAMRPLGDWDALPDGFKFQSGGVGEDFIDLVSVKSEGALLWWSCKRSHAKTKDTRPNVNAPFWELGQNLKFVATDLLLAKEAVIEGHILASSISFQSQKVGNVITGSALFQDGTRYILPKLEGGIIREIFVLPRFEGSDNLLISSIEMSDDDGGFIYTKGDVPYKYTKSKRLTLDYDECLTLIGRGVVRDGKHKTEWAVIKSGLIAKVQRQGLDDDDYTLG